MGEPEMMIALAERCEHERTTMGITTALFAARNACVALGRDFVDEPWTLQGLADDLRARARALSTELSNV